jgi:hypothetical protein
LAELYARLAAVRREYSSLIQKDALILLLEDEADGILFCRAGRKHLLNVLKQDGNLPVMLGHLAGKLFVGG